MSAFFRHLRPKANVHNLRGVVLLFCRRTSRTICAALFVLLSASAIEAIPLQTYREEVRRAVSLLEALPEWKKVESEDHHTRRVASAVQQLRETLLPIKTIEWNGTTFNVDNKWLAEALARFELLPASSDARRTLELAQMKERLKALDERLTEMGGQEAGASKDEEKRKLEGILQRPEYKEKVDEGSAGARIWRRFTDWLRSLFPRREGLQPGTAGALSNFAQIIVIALTVGVIAYVFWKFLPMFSRGRSGRKRDKQEARIVLGERLEPGQTSADLLAEAEALARAGDLRAAIRKGYIALLCELGDRKIIGLAQHKTNHDYLRAVRQIEPLHQHMQQLTRSFENHWYGFAPATETDWNAFRAGFQRITSNQ
ncbi:MAG TPA: DUF4129 domain-containing protein [Pyrinomonadaceae bacterium]|nr:DUF4129 domain-containing protein [Pyrinomonadaceae bacterium]